MMIGCHAIGTGVRVALELLAIGSSLSSSSRLLAQRLGRDPYIGFLFLVSRWGDELLWISVLVLCSSCPAQRSVHNLLHDNTELKFLSHLFCLLGVPCSPEYTA